MHLKRSYGSHHAKVINHKETVACQAVQSTAGESTCSQQVSMYVKVGQTARERIEFMLCLKGTQIPKSHLILKEHQKFLSQEDKHVSLSKVIIFTLPEVCPQKKNRLVWRIIATPGTSTVNCQTSRF